MHLGCWIIGTEDDDFMVFRMPCMELIVWNWGYWFNWTEDAELLGTEGADWLVLRMLILWCLKCQIYWNWGCWFIGTEDAGLIQLRMLWIIGTENADWLVLRKVFLWFLECCVIQLRMPI